MLGRIKEKKKTQLTSAHARTHLINSIRFLQDDKVIEHVPTLLHLFCRVKDLRYSHDRHVAQLRLEPVVRRQLRAASLHNCSTTPLSTCGCIPGVVVPSTRIARDGRALTCELAVLRFHLGRTTKDGLMLVDTQTPSQIATPFPRQASSRGGLLDLKEKVTRTSTSLKTFSFHRLWTSDERRQCARSRVLPASPRKSLNSDARASRL